MERSRIRLLGSHWCVLEAISVGRQEMNIRLDIDQCLKVHRAVSMSTNCLVAVPGFFIPSRVGHSLRSARRLFYFILIMSANATTLARNSVL